MAVMVDPAESRAEQQGHILNRQVRITLHPSAKEKELVLHWHTGRPSQNTLGHKSERKIRKKSATIVSIQQAWGWFGFFTVPHDIENEPDESKRGELKELYDLGKRQALLFFDYPRPIKVADGAMPIGPSRLPDVLLTVIEDDGSEWEPIRLHELYEVGDFDKIQIPEEVDPHQQRLEENTALGAAIARELAKIGAVGQKTPAL